MKRTYPRAGPPPEFLDRMRQLLSPGEYDLLVGEFSRPVRQGLRVNTLKVSVADFISISPFSLEPLGDWDPAAFEVTDDSRPGRHVYHEAGLYYLQDPSAMVAGALMELHPTDLVLDLAAAPGGKATHLLSRLNVNLRPGSALQRSKDQAGLLVANDVHAGRARLLAENLARWGAVNVLVTQDVPVKIGSAFGSTFDHVLIDAPCSGEGMFRRMEAVEWSSAIVAACARRQNDILTTARDLVRPGGELLYATCTYSPEENEQVIAGFLSRYPDFELIEPTRYPGFAPGRPEWAAVENGKSSMYLSRAVRLWPHHFPGEGHFFALMHRDGAQTSDETVGRFVAREPSRGEMASWSAFQEATLTFTLPPERLHVHDNRLYLLPARALYPGRVRLVRYGLLLGELRPRYFRPAHDFALALRTDDVQRSADLSPDNPYLPRYRAGDDIPLDGSDGWVLVAVTGFGLGWAKRVGGRLKNHLPRHLRRA